MFIVIVVVIIVVTIVVLVTNTILFVVNAAGLLEGAHTGRGLGHEFLRHCQRARMLVHVVDGNSPDPLGDYKAIQMELELFAEDLAFKPQVSIKFSPSMRCPCFVCCLLGGHQAI